MNGTESDLDNACSSGVHLIIAKNMLQSLIWKPLSAATACPDNGFGLTLRVALNSCVDGKYYKSWKIGNNTLNGIK
jgi:hypothetical protein